MQDGGDQAVVQTIGIPHTGKSHVSAHPFDEDHVQRYHGQKQGEPAFRLLRKRENRVLHIYSINTLAAYSGGFMFSAAGFRLLMYFHGLQRLAGHWQVMDISMPPDRK